MVLAAPARGHDTHAHGTFTAGEPGDPSRPARVVQIVMREASGKMQFIPERLTVKRGEQVRFVLVNNGELEHEFVLASTEENLKHAEAMQQNPDMEHNDPNGRRVASRNRDELLWRFTKAGAFEYGCLIPGHREAGMTGTVLVR